MLRDASIRGRISSVLRLSSVGACCALLGCNSILGIDSASPAPNDAGFDGGAVTNGATANYTVSCANYCNLMAEACGPTASAGDNTEYLGSDGGVCAAICPNFEPTAEVLDPNVTPTPGDTLNCRVWHANAALTLGEPHVHCAHSGPLGGDLCDPNMSDPCTPFCKLDLAFCTGDQAAYASVQDCLNACRPDAGYAGFPYEIDPANTEVSDLAPQFQGGSNTLNCRMYHLENALYFGDKVTHCPHTAANGGHLCIDPVAAGDQE